MQLDYASWNLVTIQKQCIHLMKQWVKKETLPWNLRILTACKQAFLIWSVILEQHPNCTTWDEPHLCCWHGGGCYHPIIHIHPKINPTITKLLQRWKNSSRFWVRAQDHGMYNPIANNQHTCLPDILKPPRMAKILSKHGLYTSKPFPAATEK